MKITVENDRYIIEPTTSDQDQKLAEMVVIGGPVEINASIFHQATCSLFPDQSRHTEPSEQ